MSNSQVRLLSTAIALLAGGVPVGFYFSIAASLVGAGWAPATMAVASPAQQLYRGRGWQVLVAKMHFPGVARPYSILGKELR